MTQNTKVVRVVDGKQHFEAYKKKRLLRFLKKLAFGLDEKYILLHEIVDKISEGLTDIVTITDLYDLASETVAAKVIYHPDHSILAGRIEASKLQKKVPYTFSENITRLREHKKNKRKTIPLISDSFYKVVKKNHKVLDNFIQPARDFELTYFGIKTLQKSYLLRIYGDIAETPQYLFLRVAIGIHGDNLVDIEETYQLMSQKYFIHASPTLFSAGSNYNYLSSCFLLAMEDDSIDGIYKTLHKAALISKAAGGIGLHVHNIRGTGANISSTNGTSSGLVPMLRVYNNTARYVDQGGNKRPGAFAIYIEPWHSDVMEVLDLRKNHGKEEMRARDLFYGLWIPDLFMKRVKDDQDWSLFSPDEAPGLSDVYGDKFVQLYEKYEKEGLAYKTIKAQKLWSAILDSQIETGGPFMLYKDSCNHKSNQKNLGTIKSSNLCCEIVEYSSPEETAVCNLGSLALPQFVRSCNENDTRLEFDFEKLHSVAQVLAKNLNKIIDVTKYPVESAEISNKRHRPIAIGVQGLADLFLELRIPFDSMSAKKLNIQIFETIYHAAIEASIDLSKKEGPYETFQGSPASQGMLQFDLWSHKPSPLYNDWDTLKKKVKIFGIRNSLLVAPMPTASTSQILGFNECFEPYTSNIYNRRVLSGEFQVVNKYLMKDLIDLGLWNSSMRNKLILADGSIQNIAGIPQSLKNLYKTVWEISQRVVVDLAADRAKFIDQSQSMNIHLRDPTYGKLTSCHFYSWEKGLKTGMYYLRTSAASKAIKFTVDEDQAKKLINTVGLNKQLVRKRYLERDNNDSEDEIKKMKENNSDIHKTEANNKDSKLLEAPKYDIYNNTLLSCNIKEPYNCDSCSG